MAMAKFRRTQGLKAFQAFNHQVYGPLDDRFYSLGDLLTQHQRFSMRALKGVRKRDMDRIRNYLMVSLSFLMAVANRLHINCEEEVWKRFPGVCSYCGAQPCRCKPNGRKRRNFSSGIKTRPPKSIDAFQRMFNQIYPSAARTLEHAGIHFAEEVGEVAEAVFYYIADHSTETLREVASEIADCISCVFGIANSADINISVELARMYYRNCHVCHKLPCVCSFKRIARY